MTDLLAVNDLHVHFRTPQGTARAVDGVDLSVRPGETVGLVGESGCGKSVTALAIMRLLPPRNVHLGGRIEFSGRDLLTCDDDELRRVRGREISMIFQEPMTSLNPVFTVGDQLREVYRLHLGLNRREANTEAERMLARVGFRQPAESLRAYPGQMSGGMRQRVMIAMAMAARPKLLIADEPTTALDVTIQAQVLELLDELRRETGTAILFITHDMGVVAELCDRVVVLYAGQVAETAPVRTLFDEAFHPYTRGLLNAVRRLDAGDVEQSIPGRVDPATNYPPGCRFASRCPHAMERCRREIPPLESRNQSRVACWLYAAN
ncbi:MAG TPA: ABC transporter ATP-binding protein [bacterium]|nr:ABC transporter ATP-binding protein [bacterium]